MGHSKLKFNVYLNKKVGWNFLKPDMVVTCNFFLSEIICCNFWLSEYFGYKMILLLSIYKPKM